MWKKFVFICLICLVSFVYVGQAGADDYDLYVTVKDSISKTYLRGVRLHVFQKALGGGSAPIADVTTGLFGRAVFRVDYFGVFFADIDYCGASPPPNCGVPGTLTHAHFDWDFTANLYYIAGSRPRRGEHTILLNPLIRFPSRIRVLDAISTEAHPLPLANVEVKVYNRNEPTPDLVTSGLTNANGEFDVLPLPAESYKFTLTKTGFTQVGDHDYSFYAGNLNVRAPMQIVINPYDPGDPQKCCLNTTITVMDEADHDIKIAGAAVQVYDSGGQPQLPPDVTTDSEGRITLPMLNEGNYYYYITRVNFDDEWGTFVNVAGQNPVSVFMTRQ